MNQQQMQYRPAVGNGINQRHMDGSRVESYRPDLPSSRSLQPTRAVANSFRSGVSSHQSHNCNKIDTVNHVTGSRHSAEDGGEVPSLGEGRSVLDRPLNDRLLFMTACLVGQPVAVQVKNGSIYSGIFHTANAEKDYGVVLKMARLTKDGSVKGGKGEPFKDAAKKTPLKTFIIHARELVQIIAKDVPLSGEPFPNGRARDNHSEILTDAFLSQSHHMELERELKRWMPDKDDPKDFGLETTFQSTWNRNWDQFETNKALFGVESTFDEELYTTKLERGPQLREREKEAWRIAHEIEGETTRNFHIAEERGAKLTKEIEVFDEEGRFSSVLRPETMDVGEDSEDKNADVHNEATSGNCSTDDLLVISDDKPSSIIQAENKTSRPPSVNSSQGVGSPYQSSGGRDSPLINSLISEPTNIQALNLEPGRPQVTEEVYREFNEFKQQENARRGRKQREEQLNELKSFSESLKDLTDFEPRPQKYTNKVSTVEAGTRTNMSIDAKPNTAPTNAAQGTPMVSTRTCMPSASTSPMQAVSVSSNTSASDIVKSTIVHSESLSLTLSNSSEASRIPATNHIDRHSYATLSSVSQLEPRSGVGSLPSNNEVTAIQSNSILVSSMPAVSPPLPSSPPEFAGNPASVKKSILNPNAKEFKLNPNAKAFTPNVTTVRPLSPVVPAPFHVSGTIPPIGPMQAMPVGIGVNPLIHQPGQLPKYTQYNSMPMTAGTASSPFLQAPITFASGVSSGVMPPPLPGPPTIKISSQAQPPIIGYSFGSQQPVRYSSQNPSVQPAYIHPNGQLYSQPMMFNQPGQVLYIQPFPQASEMIQGAPMPPHQQAQASNQQSQQPKHRGGNIQGVQVCIAPPFLAGQQHFFQQAQMSHLQPSPVLTQTSMPAIQPQGMVSGIVPLVQNTSSLPGGNPMRVGGKTSGNNIQQ